MAHPNTEELLDYVDGRLAGAVLERVRGHLEAGCAACAEEVGFWRRLRGVLAPEPLPAPSEAALRRAVALAAELPRPAGFVETLRAALTLDTRLQHAAAVRDAGPQPFRLVFTAGETAVDLLCEPAEAGWSISGRVLRPPGPIREVHLGEAVLAPDPEGEFEHPACPPGSLEVVVVGMDYRIALPAVRLESPP